MPIRVFKPSHGRPRHQKVLENALFDNGDLLSGHTVIIELVITIEVDTLNALGRGVINDGNERWQYRLIHLFRKCLALTVTLLAMAFDAMAEDLVEKYAASS